jgi:hypothetical protein
VRQSISVYTIKTMTSLSVLWAFLPAYLYVGMAVATGSWDEAGHVFDSVLWHLHFGQLLVFI